MRRLIGNIAFIALIVFVSAVDSSNAAEATGKYPERFPACQYVLFDSAGTVADSVDWQIKDKDVLHWVSKDSRSIVVWVPSPRKLVVILKAKDKAGSDAWVAVCDVTGDQPGPAPSPEPQPQPGPQPKPDIKPEPVKPLGPFAQRVFDAAMKIDARHRQPRAADIAAALKTVRAKITGLPEFAKDEAAVVAEIKHQIGSGPPEWFEWGKWWNVQGPKEFRSSGKMTPDNWYHLLDSTIAGLSAVK